MAAEDKESQAHRPEAIASAVQIQDVSKVYRHPNGTKVVALDGFSLSVREGEMVSLIGPSGCGKSTLLRMIAGLESPTQGDLRVDGQPIRGPSATRGFMFQDPSLFPWLNVRRNIQAGLVARGVLHSRRAAVEEYLELVGLAPFAHLYPHQLSGGMAQRAALARALINDPQLLLLDEPLGALDQFTRMRMQDEVLQLWRVRRITMLLVTHDIDEAIYMSDRIVIMTPSPGRVEQVITVPQDRPRHRNDARFLALRSEILERLNFTGE